MFTNWCFSSFVCVLKKYVKVNPLYHRCILYKNIIVGGGCSKIYAPFGKYLCTLCILYQFLDIWSNFDPKMQFRAPILLIFVKNYPFNGHFTQKYGSYGTMPQHQSENIHAPSMAPVAEIMHHLQNIHLCQWGTGTFWRVIKVPQRKDPEGAQTNVRKEVLFQVDFQVCVGKVG